MSFGEVRSRLGDAVRRRTERKLWRQGTANAPIACPRLVESCARLVPGANRNAIGDLRSRFEPTFAQFHPQVRENAQRILSDRYRMLGHEFDLSGQVDWHSDPNTGYRWERDFYGDMPLYSAPGERDVKYPWELSRQQFLVELAHDYQFSNNHKAAERVREVILDWIEKNACYEGINWTSALEVSMRSTSWIWALASLADWEGWNDSDLSKIGSSLRDHGEYLSHHFSYYSSPYNHLIGEGAGLLLISSLFGESEGEIRQKSNQWRELAVDVLLRSGPRQFYDDFFCVEQATGYHYFTLGFLMLAYCCSRSHSDQLTALEPVIRSAFRTGMQFRRSDGSWPAIGDLDSAHSLPVRPMDDWCFDPLHSLAAVVFEDASLITTDAPGQELYWLTGTEGLKIWNEMDRPGQDDCCILLPDSGYAIGGSGGDKMVFDAGSVSHGLFPDATPSTAHGHADTLQVLFDLDGQRILDDGGMPFYGGHSDWVAHFRGVGAHNTVSIEGAPFVRRAGRLAWSHEVAKPEIDASFQGDVCFAFGRVQWDDVIHERAVCLVRSQGIWIADYIAVPNARNATWFWQLPDERLEHSEDAIRWADRFSFNSDTTSGTLDWNLQSSNETSPVGWRCFGYGERSPGNRLSASMIVDEKILVLTSIGYLDRPVVSVQHHALEVASSNLSEDSQQHEFRGFQWRIANVESSPVQTH